MEFYQNILIILIVSLITCEGAEVETTTITSDNDTQVSVHNDSQLDRLFFQEIPNEFQPIIPSLVKELDNLTDEEFLQFLKKATERAKQAYDDLKSIHDQLEKNLTSVPTSQRLKRCHACHKKKMKYMDPYPVFVPVAVPIYYPKGGGCGGYGGCGGGHQQGNYGYQKPQTCHSCGGGGGGYGGSGYGQSSSFSSASASASSGSWGKK